jgi:ADP-heptose:LPS heptosyltransferase
MTTSHASPRPVRTGRYRYTKWRWRLLVGAFDAAGGVGARLWRRIRPPTPQSAPRRILILQLDHMGDAILTSPLVTNLRVAYPTARIDVLASPSNRDVFAANPDIDGVRVASRNWFERRPGRWALGSAVWKLGRSLRGAGYDLGIDVRGDILSVLVLTLAGIPRRLGWTMGGGGFLLTDVADWVPGRHEVGSRSALLTRLGIDPERPLRVVVHVGDDDRVLVAQKLQESWPARETRSLVGSRNATAMSRAVQFSPPEWNTRNPSPPVGEGRERNRNNSAPNVLSFDEPDWLHAGRFGEEAPLLAVHIGAGTSAKRWPLQHWRELVGRFLIDGWRVILIGGQDDVRAGAELGRHERLRDWTGQLSVTESAALLERADFFIGSDSGPAHIAASAGIPSVVLFSGTNRPRQWRPWSRRTLILRNKVACRPCHQKVCPLADHPCMAGITPDRVHRAAKRWWARLHREESPHVPI